MSIRRLNQLGYFKPLEEQKGIQVDKTPNESEKVDLTLKLEEQNRNQLSFGAGVSQYYGLFVNGPYSTTNFLGKGETLSVAVETGSRSNSYQASLTEPYVFDRPISVGASLFSRKSDIYLYSSKPEYSEVREGASITFGLPVRNFSRLFSGYTYEVIDSAGGEAFNDAQNAARQRLDVNLVYCHRHHREWDHDLHAVVGADTHVAIRHRRGAPRGEPCGADIRVRHGG